MLVLGDVISMIRSGIIIHSQCFRNKSQISLLHLAEHSPDNKTGSEDEGPIGSPVVGLKKDKEALYK